MTTLTITLPLPPRALAANSRSHWAKKAHCTKKYRMDAGLAAVDALNRAGLKPPRWNFALGQATFYWRSKHPKHQPDQSNLNHSIKAAIDGICDAGLMHDDRGLILEKPLLEHDKDKPRVEIRVRALTMQQFDKLLRGRKRPIELFRS